MPTLWSGGNGHVLRGLTLIEVLAAIVVLTLVMTAFISNAGSLYASATFDDVARQIEQLDRQARLVARTEGEAGIVHHAQRSELVLISPAIDDALRTLIVPGHITVALRIDGQTEFIHYDSAGRSHDFVLTLRSDDRIKNFIIDGLTGTMRHGEGASQ